jgi:hypothetical protein
MVKSEDRVSSTSSSWDPLDLRLQETSESVIGHALLEFLCGALPRKLRVESADQFDVLL